jgi:hypothetical protein
MRQCQDQGQGQVSNSMSKLMYLQDFISNLLLIIFRMFDIRI